MGETQEGTRSGMAAVVRDGYINDLFLSVTAIDQHYEFTDKQHTTLHQRSQYLWTSSYGLTHALLVAVWVYYPPPPYGSMLSLGEAIWPARDHWLAVALDSLPNCI